MSDSSQSEPLNQPPKSAAVPVFRCVCGQDLPMSHEELACPKCGRRMTPASFSLAQTQTLVLHGEPGTTTPSTSGIGAQPGPQPGDRFGHFEIVEQLGAGGMGAVFLALDTSLQRYVALKVIHATEGGSSSAHRIDRLKQEAVAQARLNHPNVVTIYFVGEEDGQPFFAMELVAGSTLAEVRRVGSMPFRELVEVAHQVTRALEHAQAFDIVHGDIKPSNLLLDEQHRVKLSDFGLARFLSRQSAKDGTISGTLDYLAPEVFRGSPPSFQSDMYSLGVTLFELTYGSRPFRPSGTTLNEKIEAAQQRELVFPQESHAFPEGWIELLTRLLAKQPQDRFESYTELRLALSQLRAKPQIPAGRFPRVFAFGVDYFTASLLYGLTSIPWVLTQVLDFSGGWYLFTMVAMLITPLGLMAFAFLEVQLPKTPGRYLFQLQVVDDHGLRPRRSRLILRHFLRMAFLWTMCLASLTQSVLSWLVLPAVLASQLFLLVDAGMVLFGPAGLSLHDLICKTRVVLDHGSQDDEPA